ncbi:nitronate monooxygenase [Lysinibacillus sp. FSL K6-3209]|uniref:NAD(P)H-dependent flavin oxidoreductase n=1 Tax=Lysinibacillus sp. FSL K6-3209 TaxID=2921497 RepID=UPI0030DB0BE7
MLDKLKYPIIQAPMAGGVSTPALAAAVSNAGGLGFLAAGYKTTEDLRKDIQEFRNLSSNIFGVNLFVPNLNEINDNCNVDDYRAKLEKEALLLGTTVGDPIVDDDDWHNKIDLIKEEKIPVVSFTFGCPSTETIKELKQNGSFVIVTVTNLEEAKIANESGADALCLQGIEAGGHRASFSNNMEPHEEYGLLVFISIVKKEIDIPIIAAGGIMDGCTITAVLGAGASAAQLGTAFLLCPESGTNPVYRKALTDSDFTTTHITRAFTGRRARGLVNYFLSTYDKEAPAAYPQVHYMTQKLRKEAVQSDNPKYMSLWAGQGYKLAQSLPAADLIKTLMLQVNTNHV